jgi:hypothetical protein
MRKISLILLSVGALCAVSLCWQGLATAEGTRLDPPQGFGQRIAGVWLAWFEWEGYDPAIEPPTAAVLTINDNLEMTGTSGAAYGRDDPARYSLRNTWHVTAKMTGPRELTERHFIFMYTAEGELFIIIRSTGVFIFSQDFEQLDGTVTAEAFMPEQLLGPDLRGPIRPNLDDPEEPPFYGTYPGGVIHAKRLHVP